jgi:hypothetical protein
MISLLPPGLTWFLEVVFDGECEVGAQRLGSLDIGQPFRLRPTIPTRHSRKTTSSAKRSQRKEKHKRKESYLMTAFGLLYFLLCPFLCGLFSCAALEIFERRGGSL